MPSFTAFPNAGSVRAAAFLLLTATALALPAAAKPPKEVPPALKILERNGVQILNSFDAPGGLTGYAVRSSGQGTILYVTPDGEHVLAGTLLDAQGHNLTREHMAKYMPKPDLSKAWAKLEKADYVAVGADDPKRVVYVFTDPNCPYCHALWKATVPYYKEGLQVRYVPVAVLRDSSMGKAAAILGDEDPPAALRRNEKAFKDGGIEPVKDPHGKGTKGVNANTHLMQQLGIQGTPAIFYKDADGKVRSANGMPSLDRLARIYRLPKQDNGDPALSQFR